VEPKYFEQTLKHFNLEAENTVYFEHNPEAVKSAQSMGITSYHYDPDKKDMDALRSFLDRVV